MQRFLKTPGGIILFLLFLFPQVQKGWHDYEHRNDTHCDASAEVHFHELEHVCNLCDFSIAVGLKEKVCNYDIFLNAIKFSFTSGNLHAAAIFTWNTLPPRAPPFVA